MRLKKILIVHADYLDSYPNRRFGYNPNYKNNLDIKEIKNMNKFKNIKKLTKVTIVLSLFLIAGIVTATLMVYFGEVDTTINIKQSVTIDNSSYDKSVKLAFDLYHSGNISHEIQNKADVDVSVSINITGLIDGLNLTFYSDGSLITFPITIKANSVKDIVMHFDADINLVQKNVKVIARFSAVET
jgi:hypothetical protein